MNTFCIQENILFRQTYNSSSSRARDVHVCQLRSAENLGEGKPFLKEMFIFYLVYVYTDKVKSDYLV